MRDRTKGVFIGMGGFFSGTFAGSVADLPMWPKVLLIATVSVAVSTIIWAFLRPGRTT
jgi:hypothetical protein